MTILLSRAESQTVREGVAAAYLTAATFSLTKVLKYLDYCHYCTYIARAIYRDIIYRALRRLGGGGEHHGSRRVFFMAAAEMIMVSAD